MSNQDYEGIPATTSTYPLQYTYEIKSPYKRVTTTTSTYENGEIVKEVKVEEEFFTNPNRYTFGSTGQHMHFDGDSFSDPS